MPSRRLLLTALLLLTACSSAGRRGEPDPMDGSEYVDLDLMLDQSIITDDDGDALLLIEVATTETRPDARAPARIAIVIDTSGSMEGDKIANARRAAHELVDRMSVGDQLTLVSYGEAAQTHLRSYPIRRDRTRAHEAVDALEADGNTCTSCGLQAAYDALSGGATNGVHRVVLLTDGHANRGIVDEAGLRAMAHNAHANRGVDTATIGLGRLHNEVALAGVAESGAANYYFLHNSDYLAELLDHELASIHGTAVRDLVVRLTPGDGVAFAATYNVVSSFGDDIVLDIGQLASGEKRRFVVELQLPQGDMGRAVQATATFADVAGRPYVVDSAARIERSDDLARVESSIEAGVIEEHALLVSAAQIDEAMNLIDSGYRGAAIETLEANQARLEQYAGLGSAEVQAEIDQMETMIQTFGALAEELVPEPEYATDAMPAPAAAAPAERGNVMLYRGQARERRRGTARSDAYHQAEAFDMSELE